MGGGGLVHSGSTEVQGTVCVPREPGGVTWVPKGTVMSSGGWVVRRHVGRACLGQGQLQRWGELMGSSGAGG